MPVVTMPDGVAVTFPDDMLDDQIRSLIATKFPDAVKGIADRPSFARMATDIPGELYKASVEPLLAANTAINPFSQGAQERRARGEPPSFLGTGKALVSPLMAAAGLIEAPIRAVGGNAIALADEALRSGGAAIYGNEKVQPALGVEASKDRASQALMALRPRGDPMMAAPPAGNVRGPFEIPAGRSSLQWDPTSGAAPPVQPTPNGPLGVTLSEGQSTRDLAAIQREQAALRAPSGRSGDRAQEFAAQQRGEVQSASERVAQSFDPFNMRVAETPQEAGQIAQRAIQQEAASRKAGVTQAYDEAKALPGEIKADAFKDIATSIKTDLSARPDPVVIDDKLTPFASHAIKDVEQRIANLQVQNRASPFGQPPQNQIVGLSLEGVDQMRKRLVAFRRDAYSSGNGADGRAARGVVEAFDNHIDQAIKNGAFTGDQRAIKAWGDARAAHADYRSTFGKGKNDPVGRVVERILGTRDNPAAIPNDVADFLYGGSGINPSSLNVHVANRVKSILGDQSPEWSAVRQGLFARLTETPPGVTDMGPGKIAQRINKFLSGDGKEMAEAVFSPLERSLIKQYGDLHRALEVPQAGAQWSNNLPYLKAIMGKISSGLGAVIGNVVGHAVSPAVGAVTSAVGAKATGAINSMSEAKQIARQMPLVAEATQKFQRAMTAYNKLNSPPSQAALQVATANLARSLRHIGVDLTLQGQNVGRAEDQPQVNGPPR